MSPDYVWIQIRPRAISNIIGSIQVHDLVTIFGELMVVGNTDDDNDDGDYDIYNQMEDPCVNHSHHIPAISSVGGWNVEARKSCAQSSPLSSKITSIPA